MAIYTCDEAEHRVFTDEEFIEAYTNTGITFCIKPTITPADFEGKFKAIPLAALLCMLNPEMLDKYPFTEMPVSIVKEKYEVVKMGVTLTKTRDVELPPCFAVHPDFSFDMYRWFAAERNVSQDYIMGVSCGSNRQAYVYNKASIRKEAQHPDRIGGLPDFREGYREGWMIRDALIYAGLASCSS